MRMGARSEVVVAKVLPDKVRAGVCTGCHWVAKHFQNVVTRRKGATFGRTAQFVNFGNKHQKFRKDRESRVLVYSSSSSSNFQLHND